MTEKSTLLNMYTRMRWILSAAAFVMFFLLIFVLLASRYYAVEVTLTASSNDHVRIYWAPRNTPFNEVSSRALTVSEGRHSYQVPIFAVHRPVNIHIKAGEELHTLNLEEVRFKRLGRSDGVLRGEQLLQKTKIVSGKLEAGPDPAGLAVTAHDGKIRLAVKRLENGQRHVPWILLAWLIAGCVVVIYLYRVCISEHAQSGHGLRYSLLLVSLSWVVPVVINVLSFELLVVLRALSVAFLLMLIWSMRRQIFERAGPGGWLNVIRYSPLPITFFALILWSASHQFSWFAGFDYRSLMNPTQLAEGKEQFESRLKDWFLHKTPLVRINSEVKVGLMGTSPTPKVIIGRQGFMYEGRGERRVEGDVIRGFDNISDYLGRNPFNDRELNQWAQVLQERHDWLQNRGVPYLFVMAPTKAMIYPEHLPWMLQDINNVRRRYDVLYDYLVANTTVPILDLRPALLQAKASHSDPELYYRTDFHWNFFGSFFAYQAIVHAANTHFPHLNLSPLKLSDFDIEVDEQWAHPKFMAMLGLNPEKHNDEHYIRMVPRSMERFTGNQLLPSDGIRDVHLPVETVGKPGDQQPIRTIRNPAAEREFMLVLGDSFIQKTLLYMSVHAKRLVYQRSVFQLPMHVLKDETPELVVQEILNMFILRQPPHNPSLLRQHKRRN